GGNREVSPSVLLGARGHLRAAWVEANIEEGGSWEKHGFPHGSEPKASDAHGPTFRLTFRPPRTGPPPRRGMPAAAPTRPAPPRRRRTRRGRRERQTSRGTARAAAPAFRRPPSGSRARR